MAARHGRRPRTPERSAHAPRRSAGKQRLGDRHLTRPRSPQTASRRSAIDSSSSGPPMPIPALFTSASRRRPAPRQAGARTFLDHARGSGNLRRVRHIQRQRDDLAGPEPSRSPSRPCGTAATRSAARLPPGRALPRAPPAGGGKPQRGRLTDARRSSRDQRRRHCATITETRLHAAGPDRRPAAGREHLACAPMISRAGQLASFSRVLAVLALARHPRRRRPSQSPGNLHLWKRRRPSARAREAESPPAPPPSEHARRRRRAHLPRGPSQRTHDRRRAPVRRSVALREAHSNTALTGSRARRRPGSRRERPHDRPDGLHATVAVLAAGRQHHAHSRRCGDDHSGAGGTPIASYLS